MTNLEISRKEREREFSSSQQILVIFKALEENGFSNIPRWVLSSLCGWCEVGGESRTYKPISRLGIGDVLISEETFSDLDKLELNGLIEISERGETYQSSMENLLRLTSEGRSLTDGSKRQFPLETDEIGARSQELIDRTGGDFKKMCRFAYGRYLVKQLEELRLLREKSPDRNELAQGEARLFSLRDQILIILGNLEELGRPEISEESLSYLDLIWRVGGELPEALEYPEIDKEGARRALFPLVLFSLTRNGLIEVDEGELFSFRLTDKGKERIQELVKEWPEEIDWFKAMMKQLGPNADETIPHPTTARAAYAKHLRGLSNKK